MSHATIGYALEFDPTPSAEENLAWGRLTLSLDGQEVLINVPGTNKSNKSQTGVFLEACIEGQQVWRACSPVVSEGKSGTDTIKSLSNPL